MENAVPVNKTALLFYAALPTISRSVILEPFD
jgi:hypothetical protein